MSALVEASIKGVAEGIKGFRQISFLVYLRPIQESR